MQKKRVAIIPGDGIGKEIFPFLVEIIKKMNLNVDLCMFEVGREKFLRDGVAFDADFIEKVRMCDAILFGSISTPSKDENNEHYKSPLLTMRRELNLAVNVRPSSNLINTQKKKLIVFRENTEGLYAQKEFQRDENTYVAEKIVSVDKTKEFAEFAFRYMKNEGIKNVTIVTKSNVLRKTDGTFFDVCKSVGKEYDIAISEEYVDAACYHLARNFDKYDAIMTENLYGDIISDLIAGLSDGLGMAISECYGKTIALFEPVHGSAPDIAFKDQANPYASLICLVSMLKYLKFDFQSQNLMNLIEQEIAEQHFTIDLNGNYKTSEILNSILERI